MTRRRKGHRRNSSTQPTTKRTIPAGVWVRFAIIGLLWLLLVGMVVARSQMNFFTLFAIVASAIVVFVPLYKKYVSNDESKRNF
jgi:4-hydroxybenzoate polyprenyltransferase